MAKGSATSRERQRYGSGKEQRQSTQRASGSSGSPFELIVADGKVRATEYQEAVQRWQEAMPHCLAAYWSRMHDLGLATAPLHEDLEAAYPDPEARALELFRWFGAGKGSWNEFPAYEGVAESLLLEYSTDVLLAALTDHRSLTAGHLEGAARYFAGWAFRQQKRRDIEKLSPDLKRQLLQHTLQYSNPENRMDAERAFAD